MKRYMLLLVVLLAGALTPVQAQDVAGMKEIVTALSSIREKGKAAPYGFDLKYTYTNESKPAEILDSLIGKIEIAGNNYYLKMDSTEMIQNEQHKFILFKKEKLILLSAAKQDSTEDPLLNMQSMLARSGTFSYKSTRKGPVKIIELSFAPGSPCRQMKMTLDTVSQQLLSVDYLVKSSILMQQDAQVPEGYDEYASVRAIFYNYHSLTAGVNRFDEDLYFYKEEGEYKPTAAYSNFQIILATPNL